MPFGISIRVTVFRYIYLVLSVYEGTVTPIIWTCLGSHRRTVYRISCPHGCVHALVVEVRVVAGTRYLVGVCDQVFARRGGRKLQPTVRFGVPSSGAASAFRTATSFRGPATAGTTGATSLVGDSNFSNLRLFACNVFQRDSFGLRTFPCCA